MIGNYKSDKLTKDLLNLNDMITPKDDDPLKRESSKAQRLANSKALLGKVLSPTKEKFPSAAFGTPAAAIDGNGPMPNGTFLVVDGDTPTTGGGGDSDEIGGGGGGGGNNNSNSAINNNSINNNTAELNGTVPDELEGGFSESTTRNGQDDDLTAVPALDTAMTNVSTRWRRFTNSVLVLVMFLKVLVFPFLFSVLFRFWFCLVLFLLENSFAA